VGGWVGSTIGEWSCTAMSREKATRRHDSPQSGTICWDALQALEGVRDHLHDDHSQCTKSAYAFQFKYFQDNGRNFVRLAKLSWVHLRYWPFTANHNRVTRLAELDAIETLAIHSTTTTVRLRSLHSLEAFEVILQRVIR